MLNRSSSRTSGSIPLTDRLSTQIDISAAIPEDVDRIIEIDLAAGQLFAPLGLLYGEALDDHIPADVLLDAIGKEHLDVAWAPEGNLAGFVLVSKRGNSLYLDQISVDPEYGNRGIGSQLMRHLFEKAKRLNETEIVLSTFRDVSWNGPFYAGLGFREISRHKFAPYMLEIERAQAPFMDISKRIFMKKRIRRAK